jgi:hypothetical protein
VAAPGAGHCLAVTQSKLAEYTNLLIDSAFIGCYLPIAEFNLGPCAQRCSASLPDASAWADGGWACAARSRSGSACSSPVRCTVCTSSRSAAACLAQGLGVAVIFVYVTVFSYQSYGQAQRMVKVAKQMEGAEHRSAAQQRAARRAHPSARAGARRSGGGEQLEIAVPRQHEP